MKKFYIYFTLVIMAMLTISCQQEIDNPYEDLGSPVKVTFTGEAINYETDEPESKSNFIASSDDGNINEFQVIVYQNGVFVGTTYAESNSLSLDFSLSSNATYNMYAIANVGKIDESYIRSSLSTEKALKENAATLFEIEGLSKLAETGLPMSGSLIRVSPTDEMQFAMKRLLACYRIKLDKSKRPDYVKSSTLESIQIHNVNKKVYLFKDNCYASSSDDLLEKFDYTSKSDLAILNSDAETTDEVVFYMLENMQTTGNHVTTSVDNWNKVHNKDGVDKCTYLTLNFSQTGENGIAESKPLYLYLGKDFKSNFDVKRNTRVSVTLTEPDFIKDDITGTDDNSQPSFEFENTVSSFMAGEQKVISFSYKNLKSAPTVNDFDPGNAHVNISSFTCGSATSGTGYFVLSSTKGWCGTDCVMSFTSADLYSDSYIKASFEYDFDSIRSLSCDPSSFRGIKGATIDYSLEALLFSNKTINVTSQATASFSASTVGSVSEGKFTIGSTSGTVTFTYGDAELSVNSTLLYGVPTSLIMEDTSSPTLMVGDTYTFRYKGFRLDTGDIIYVTPTVVTSGSFSNESMSTVYKWAEGTWRALGVGTYNGSLTADITYNGKTTTVRQNAMIKVVENSNATVSSLTLSASDIYLARGETTNLTLIANYSNGSSKIVTTDSGTTWSFNKSATFSISGETLTCSSNANDFVTITATYGGKTTTLDIYAGRYVKEFRIVTESLSSVNYQPGYNGSTYPLNYVVGLSAIWSDGTVEECAFEWEVIGGTSITGGSTANLGLTNIKDSPVFGLSGYTAGGGVEIVSITTYKEYPYKIDTAIQRYGTYNYDHLFVYRSTDYLEWAWPGYNPANY